VCVSTKDDRTAAPEIVQGKPYSPFAAGTVICCALFRSYVSAACYPLTAFGGADAATDMWSLGVILYCLLFRGFPFYDEDPRELVQKILSQPIFVPPHVNPSVSLRFIRHLSPIIRRVLTARRRGTS
jgi:serine/threonine protein kinase